ncbi:MAG TPA: DedA family protein [Gemmatimonadaceae bacterium]|jgi:membrane protein DedA with SNARE-associated domain|nr:DedA family protein [Gemmatimonadaceae bacterium]
MHYSIASLLHNYGYLFIAVLVGVESLGIPVPGETALISGAAYAASGHLRIGLVIAAAAAGAILGDNTGYWIGRKGGHALIRRYGRLLHVNDDKMTKLHGYFDNHGAKTVFFGRFIALLRTWAAMFAGAGDMPYKRFTIYNALGGIVWAAGYGTLGYLFAKNLPHLEHILGRATWLLAVLVLLIVIGVWVKGRKAVAG